MSSSGRLDRAALASGALLAAASVPGPFGPLAGLALIPLLRALVGGVAPTRAARAGFWTGLVYAGVGFGWAPLAGPRAALAYLWVLPLLAGVVATFAFAVAFLAARSPGLALVAAPGLWAALEYARTQEWVLAVPWLHLGYALAEWPALIQGASVVGLYGLSFWIVAGNAAAVAWPRLRPGSRALLAGILAAPLMPGVLPPSGPDDAAEALTVGIAQPALSDALRHDGSRLPQNLGQLLDLSERALRGRPDLIVWPESAYQRPVGSAGDAFLAALAHSLGVPLLTGVWRPPGPGRDAWRNAAVLALGDGRTVPVAEKVHPVVLFERAPAGVIGRFLARWGIGWGRFGRGAPAGPVLLPRRDGSAVPIGAIVCIDASYPEIPRRLRAGGARLLVSVANEAATGAWSSALQERAARLRAVENRVPIVRAANTGPSSWIDDRGDVVASLPAARSAAGARTLVLAGAPPPFVALGDAPVALAAALSALAAGAAALLPRPRSVLTGLPGVQGARGGSSGASR
jgi:apolipoprotein N-acyltransferase